MQTFGTHRLSFQLLITFEPRESAKSGKPAEIKTQQEADKFNSAVSEYKSCIEDFVRQQEDVAMIHRRAASQAISEWNDFVTNDMKQ